MEKNKLLMLGVGNVGQFRKLQKSWRVWEDKPNNSGFKLMIPIELNYPTEEEEKVLEWVRSNV